MFFMCFYFALTYMCLLVIFICARAIYPREYLHEAGNEALGEPDRIMPAMARRLAHPLAAGLLLAAPYAAIMSTVAAFLLMISSSLVRDLYQRVINPNVSERTLKFSSYLITALVGVVVMIGALNPPRFLQYVIVFTGSALGCAFLIPMLLTLYWRRSTRTGILAGMLGGFFAVVCLYVLGWIDSRSQAALQEHALAVREAREKQQSEPPPPARATWLRENFSWIPGWGEKRHDPFNPIFAGGVDTLVWGMLASLILGVGGSLITTPNPELVKKFFPEA
jgi:Na+/proline symporter